MPSVTQGNAVIIIYCCENYCKTKTIQVTPQFDRLTAPPKSPVGGLVRKNRGNGSPNIASP